MSDLHFDVVGATGARRYFETRARGRIGHAYLLSGPPGVGKKTFARRLAQSLLCATAREAGLLGYDGTCSSCRLFASPNAAHPDFIEHHGMMKIGSSDAGSGFYESEELSARDVVRQLSLQSYGGGLRVLLLGDVEFAGAPAANALLKFLEEPPADVVMLLTTAAPERLLPTIRSRLVEVRFPLLARGDIVRALVAGGVEPADAERAAALAGGSLTRAKDSLEADDGSLRAGVLRWFFQSVAGDSPEQSWATRETLADGLEIVRSLARDWVARGATGGRSAVMLPDAQAHLARLPVLAAGPAVALLATLDDAQRLAATNVPPAMVGEVIRMALVAATSAA